jgi:hypothetical protein
LTRYASIAEPGSNTRLGRRHASPAQWQSIAIEIDLGLSPGPLPAGIRAKSVIN